MSFHGLTPEALVERSDSKNPATTCKGLTANGRPCRRGLGGTPSNSPGPSPIKSGDGTGVVAILDEENAAAFFCWQHKDQAEKLIAKLQQDSRRTTIIPLQKRSSIDTLAERVGVLDLEDEVDVAQSPTPARRIGSGRVRRQDGRAESGAAVVGVPERRRVKKRETLPQEWQHIQGPLMSVPDEVVQEALPEKVESRPRPSPSENQNQQWRRHRSSNVKTSWSCCIRADDGYNDDGPPARRREKRDYQYEQRRPRPQSSRPSSHRPSASMNRSTSISTPPQVAQLPQMQQRPSKTFQSQPHTPIRPPPQPLASSSTSPPHTQTQTLLSLIPSNLDPTTTSFLLSELIKPLPADDEPGYIYIFWLTPTSDPSKPDNDIASTLLEDDPLAYQNDSNLYPSLPSPSIPRSRHPSTTETMSPHRRNNELTQQALSRFASVKNAKEPDKILLKIGRAQNVHRRMTQWTKQCGQNITLIRCYPMLTSATADPMSPGGVKVPHVVRVERLIHLELRGLGMGKKEVERCEVCGREHKEWFEVPATRDGLRVVDGAVRRWVRWGEAAG